MENTNELKRIVKRKLDKGIDLSLILYPNLKGVMPKNSKAVGIKASLDQNNAANIFKAFGVDPSAENSLILLKKAIEQYKLEPKAEEQRKQHRKRLELAIQSIEHLTPGELVDSFKRTSKLTTVVTLETLAAHLQISIKKSDKDLSIAEKIKQKLAEN